MAGNERAIGLDYRNNEAQREAAFRARDTGELVLAGPVDLVQGGQGFIGRFPVFIDDGDGGKTFWGIVSAVIDVERLYSDSGLLDATCRSRSPSPATTDGQRGRARSSAARPCSQTIR